MNTQPHTWPPRTIAEIEPGPRSAFIGRAMAITLAGVEVIVVCQNLDDLTLVGDLLLLHDFDPAVIYKATVIHTQGITVEDLPEPAPAPVAMRDPEIMALAEAALDRHLGKATTESPQLDLIPKVNGEPIAEYVNAPAATPAPPEAPKRRGRPPKATRAPVADTKPYDFDAEDDEL